MHTISRLISRRACHMPLARCVYRRPNRLVPPVSAVRGSASRDRRPHTSQLTCPAPGTQSRPVTFIWTAAAAQPVQKSATCFRFLLAVPTPTSRVISLQPKLAILGPLSPSNKTSYFDIVIMNVTAPATTPRRQSESNGSLSYARCSHR